MRGWCLTAGLALVLAAGCGPPKSAAPNVQSKMEELRPLPAKGGAKPAPKSAPRPPVAAEERPAPVHAASHTPAPAPRPVPAPRPAASSRPLAPVPAPPPAPVHEEAVPQGDPDELALNASLQKLEEGKLAYSTPVSMRTGDSGNVVARIGGSSVSGDALTAGMPQQPGATVATAATKVSTKMKMALRSADFDITPLNSEEQEVGGSDPTEWQWTIAPKHSGKLSLHLVATVELKDLQRDFASINRDIDVEVNDNGAVEAFIEKNWQWLYATLGAALLAGVRFLWARWKKSKPGGDGAAKA